MKYLNIFSIDKVDFIEADDYGNLFHKLWEFLKNYSETEKQGIVFINENLKKDIELKIGKFKSLYSFRVKIVDRDDMIFVFGDNISEIESLEKITGQNTLKQESTLFQAQRLIWSNKFLNSGRTQCVPSDSNYEQWIKNYDPSTLNLIKVEWNQQILKTVSLVNNSANIESRKIPQYLLKTSGNTVRHYAWLDNSDDAEQNKKIVDGWLKFTE